LILPPLDNTCFSISREGVYPPLGLMSLINYIKTNISFVEIELVDGSIYNLNQILNQLDGDVIGLSPTIVTYQNALIIAEKAKEKESIVLMGGQHCSALAETILKKRSCVDYIVVGDGEKAMEGLLLDQQLNSIPNLFSRQYGFHDKEYIDLNSLPIPDYDGIDLTLYFANFLERFEHWAFKGALPFYSRKGCSWRDNTGGCIFCRNDGMPTRTKSPRVVWDEIIYLHEKYQVDLFWDVSDTVTSDIEWLNIFAKSKPDIPVSFLFYSRADSINPLTVDLLSRLNCHEVMIGMESGDSGILSISNKGTDLQQNISAAKQLSNSGIFVFPAFVLGLPSETKESLKKTFDLACMLCEECNVSQIACTPLMPVPGSKAMNVLKNVLELKASYMDEDMYDLVSLTEDWLKYFTTIDMDILEEWLELFLALKPISSSLGKVPVYL